MDVFVEEPVGTRLIAMMFNAMPRLLLPCGCGSAVDSECRVQAPARLLKRLSTVAIGFVSHQVLLEYQYPHQGRRSRIDESEFKAKRSLVKKENR